MSYLKQIQTAYYDSGNLDAFGRLKVASPQTLFDAQFTYDLQPLVFQAVAPAGTTITHDSTNCWCCSFNGYINFVSNRIGRFVCLSCCIKT